MESINIGTRQRIQTLEEARPSVSQPTNLQPTKVWLNADEVFDSFQLFIVLTHPGIVRLGSQNRFN